MTTVYKLLIPNEVKQFMASGEFAGTQLDIADGYIHMSSSQEQYERVLNKYYKNKDVILLSIDSSQLTDLKYEKSSNGDTYPHQYGKLLWNWVTNQQTIQNETHYIELSNLTDEFVGKNIYTYGRIHNVRKSSSKMCFVVLRDRLYTLQCICLEKDVGQQLFDTLLKTKSESLVLLEGQLSKLPESQPLIKSCYYQHFEFKIKTFSVISQPVADLPFQIDDANSVYNDETDRNNVSLPVRLNNRYFDLRTPLNNAIFRLQSSMVDAYREFLTFHGFVEIHTPKLLGVSSESGASVFELKYFDRLAYLAQSPQLYKQMMINADFKKVFEIGPVFRAEKSISNRHMCEFTGLDIELQLTPPFNYLEIIEWLWKILKYMFNHIEMYDNELIKYISEKHLFEPFVCNEQPLIIKFTDGVKLLKMKRILGTL